MVAPTEEEIVTELKKLSWFGVDGRKTRLTMEMARYVTPDKFQDAASYANAVIEAVDEEIAVLEKMRYMRNQ